jgi:SAM-dependent methyltransferase
MREMRMTRWAPYLERYQKGEWRDRILHDLILEDARRHGDGPTLLDIGCGRGFGGDLRLQQSLAATAGHYIGIEPDPEIEPGLHVTERHCCLFEEAPLEFESVDVAFANMVLEHLAAPGAFWDRLYDVLRTGGVFWGLTMDSRHWFCRASVWAERLKVKNLYLTALRGKRGEQRYENYPVYYRSNSPEQIGHYTGRFRSCEFLNFARVGQCNYYVPRLLRPLANWLDRRAMRSGRPGTVLAVRVEK